jgi:hypothetical protein
VNTYSDGYFEIALPGELAFSIDPARQDSSLQVAGDDYNISNLGRADVEVVVYPSIAAAEGYTGYSVQTGSAQLVTGKAYNGTAYADVSGAAYKDFVTKKGLFLTVIPADKTAITTAAGLTSNANADTVLEFDYSTKTGSNIVGRAKLATRAAYEGEPTYTGDPADPGVTFMKEPKAPSASSPSALVLDKLGKRFDEEVDSDGNVQYSKFVTGQSLTFYLPKKGSQSAIRNVNEELIGYPDSITSFTLAGAVDADSVYDAGSVVFQAVYVVNSATPQKIAEYGSGEANLHKNGKLHLVSYSALQ